ncbi:MAG TPA: hypothetical protein VKA60_17290 [Blastocatellia bacterium]|nr:hypothetical protein [Blastocatellia bacterium]
MEASLEASFSLDDSQPRHYQQSLTAYGINKVQSLSSYRGYLILVAANSLLIYDINDLSVPLNQWRVPEGDYMRGVTALPSPDDEQLLVTTNRAIYRLTLLNQRAVPEMIYRAAAGRFISHPALRCGEQTLVIEYEQAASASWLKRLNGGDLTSVKGHVFYELSLGQGRIFFYTEGEAFLYDCRSGALLRWVAEEPLMAVAPVFTEELGSVYLVGQRRIWRMNVDSQEPLLLALNTQSFVDACIGGKGHYMLVAHANGLCVMDAFGGIKWDSAVDFIEAQSDGKPPQAYGDFFTFSAIGRAGGRILRIHQLHQPGNFRDRFVFDKPLLCQPLFSLGKMILATGDEDQVELHTYDLGTFRAKPHPAGFVP